VIANNDDVLKKMIEAESAHDIEKLLALFTDDIVFEDVPFGIITEGKDAFKQGYIGFITAVPDFKMEPKSWVTSDRSFALEMVFSGTQKGDLPGLPTTGKRFSVRACIYGEIENGRIKGRRDYWDLVSLAKQVGRKVAA
jgi:steroid delta-isomerase-like uncharacterized protein